MKSNNKINKLYITLLILFTIFCSIGELKAGTKSDVLGIKLGMSKEKAHKKLQKIGKFEKKESKNQEVWVLNDDERFSHLIVAFNKEYTKIRFVTAKARANGKSIRYSDVLDIKKAQQTGSATNKNYVLDVPAKGDKIAYKVVARGQDPEYLTYFSIEQEY